MPAHWTAGLPISIHTLRMEGDLGDVVEVINEYGFQSTPSAWRVTPEGGSSFLSWMGFQSTPSAWRVTIANSHTEQNFRYFNPHPPHGG